ncbi:MAG: M23 family metallopeptidase, partial [Syntrophomonadaceae bacterium]|nr:M23 family metallopeptidase [Syntrophomonadaceae bacterium]
HYRRIQSGSEKIYLPKNTVLEIVEPSDSSAIGNGQYKEAVQVRIKQLALYFREEDLSINQKEKECTITTGNFTFDIIVFSPAMRINFADSAKTNINCKTIQKKLLADGEQLKGKTFKYNAKSEARYEVLVANTANFTLPDWTFWIQNKYAINDKRITLTESIADFKIYKQNFSLYEYDPTPASNNDDIILLESALTIEYGYTNDDPRKNTLPFVHFTLNGEKLAAKEQELAKYKKDVLVWDDFFKIWNDENNDIICDIKPLISKIDKDNDNVATGSELYNVYQNRNNPDNRRIIEYFRKTACKIPFEFNKDLYVDNDKYRGKLRKIGVNDSEENLNHIKELVTNLDIWEKIKDIKGIDNTQSLWHFNPVYFLSIFDTLGLLEVNPYLGETFAPGTAHEITVVDNPGFAPLYGEYPNNRQSDPEYKGNDGRRYALVTYPFNKIVNRTNMAPYYHEGVDFRGTEGQEIRSFIHAQVIGSGMGVGRLEPYGNTIILGRLNGKGIYLLGHLSELIPDLMPGAIVAPGDLVGKVGRSGYGQMEYREFSSHLHVSYYDVQYNANDIKEYLLVKDESKRAIVNSDILTLNLVKNPFYHSQPRLKK